jgi:hypothetical protein
MQHVAVKCMLFNTESENKVEESRLPEYRAMLAGKNQSNKTPCLWTAWS